MRKIIVFAIIAVISSSCSIYRKYQRPENLPTDSLYRAELIANPEDTASLGSMPWEELFTDPYLRDLIDSGLVHNTDLQTAILRVEQAQAGLYSAKWAYSPSLNLSPQGTVTSIDGNKATYTYNLGGSVSWDIDLFGSLLNAKREAQATLLQQDAYRQAVRSQIIATIATSYYALLMMDEQVRISDESVIIWREQVRAMEQQLRVGQINENAVTQARANLYGLEASNAQLKQQQKETENALCSLLGRVSGTIERGKLADQVLPETVSAGVPLQLLSNRPDVYQAEMTLAAAYYSTNQARSAFYPKLTLSGSAGWTNSLGQVVSNPGGVLLNAVASLAQPIFNKGQLRANLRVSKAEEQIARLNYKQTILNAGQEVNDALFAIETAGTMLEKHEAQCKDLERTVYTATKLYNSSTQGSYLEVLTAQQSLLNAQLSVISDKYNQLQYTVTLYKALGGGKN